MIGASAGRTTRTARTTAGRAITSGSTATTGPIGRRTAGTFSVTGTTRPGSLWRRTDMSGKSARAKRIAAERAAGQATWGPWYAVLDGPGARETAPETVRRV